MSRPRKDFWNDVETSPEDIQRGTTNRQKVLAKLINHALFSEPLNPKVVAQWHKECLSGLSYVAEEDQCLLGAYRGTSHPRLVRMRVGVGSRAGVEPHDVKGELASFFERLEKQIEVLTSKIDLDADKPQEELHQIAQVAGWAHGEWVRIHPFANGSGRTARLIANWVLVRFRLLPVVGIRPRPEQPYEPAAVASMSGDHSKITQFIIALLEDPSNRA